MDPTRPQPQVLYLVEPATVTQNIRAAYAKTSATVLGCLHVLCAVVTLAADIPLILLPSYISLEDHCVYNFRDFYYTHYFTGIWTSAIFLVSGVVTILGARTGNKYLVVATIVVSLVSALGAAGLIVLSSLNLDRGRSNHPFDNPFGNYSDYLNQTSEYTNSVYNEDHLNQTYPSYDYFEFCPTPHNFSSFTMIQTKVQESSQTSEAAFSIQIFAGLFLLFCAVASSILPCRPLCCPPRKSSGALNSLKFSLGEVTRVELVTTGGESGKMEENGDYHRF